MSPPVIQQIITSMNIIRGADGTREGQQLIQQLADNSYYFRQKLKEMGLVVFGSDDSPVVPVLMYFPAKLA